MRRTSRSKLLRDSLYQELASVLEPQGFHWQPSKGLLRKSPAGFHRVSIFVDEVGVSSLAFQIDIHFAIRINEVEQLVYPYRGMNPADARQAPTHVASLSQLLNDAHYQLLLTREADIDQVFDQVCYYVTSLGFPFFDQYQHLTMLDKLYNDTPQELSVRMKALFPRATLSMVLAKLTNRPDWKTKASALYQEFDQAEVVSLPSDKATFALLVEELFKP